MCAPDARTPDAVMEDAMKKGDESKRKGSKDRLTPERKYKFDVRQEPEAKESSRTPNIRRMELSMQTTPRDVLTKILNTQISLTAGEIIGTSRELSIALADVELCSALGWDLDLPRLSSYVSRARPVRSGPYYRFPESREPSSHGRPASLTLFRF